ncbi:transcriptional regulator family: SGT1 [Penicillium roqueforti]|uniref:transcriptional regulator family: SGT1 n=1 Tax=Penicillium roqueforti TaxID=5082 RepID=UPI00190A9A6B|nr:transcriptional regulator family: SGT1 [Penicillium roqueforti]KAF9251224.1 transcriptional regulator family: SGT1 [Penicillium roqueforti]KAI2678606.1 transcriptional regulator family: SGT1 [Penicillium roqueforti]KAI2692830.1 transcriptional regulator family: SGT1 [Penicillium roqueforti]KAI2718849.1 transcriptional regulator family: SGT1 [Penicillium roqueforti]KAI3143381.1 transcriptional regulator family: SGT1 [Penicillium roqueforti]
MTSEEDLAWFQSTFRPIPKPELPDDAVEYSIYHIPPPTPAVIDEAAETRARLLEVQRTAADLTKDLLKDYIWQRDAFRLEITKEDGITSLQGRTTFGDSIEDEWVIVYLLRELTKRHKDIWVKVADGDGEFLLIEAAGTLPAWIEPDVADNRVWINQGELRIIKPKQEAKRQVTEKISLPEARKIIQNEPGRLLRSTIIQEEAFYRLRKYPQQISENLHSAIITIPRKVAFLLHQKPAYISPAVEAFYVRDPIAMRPLRAKDASDLVFKPDDLVDVSVRFTRVGYAQLKSQEFPVPKTWAGKLPPTEDHKAYERAEAGMKLACGFEMLLYDPQNQDKPAVREMKFLLEDVDTGDETLPTDQEIQETWDKREDDEKWLDINYEDLESELKGRGEGKGADAGKFGDAGAQENLQRIVARFEEFLNDNSAGFDGADFIDDFESDSDVDDDDDDEEVDSEGEDKDASFNEEEFSRMMKEMMGMPSAPDSIRKRVEELDSDGEDDTEQIKELSRRMEAELQGTGVLDLNRRPQELSSGASTSKGKAAKISNEDDEDENININLAKNLLESLQGQAGASGPAGNMLSMMNMRMPKYDRP